MSTLYIREKVAIQRSPPWLVAVLGVETDQPCMEALYSHVQLVLGLSNYREVEAF